MKLSKELVRDFLAFCSRLGLTLSFWYWCPWKMTNIYRFKSKNKSYKWKVCAVDCGTCIVMYYCVHVWRGLFCQCWAEKKVNVCLTGCPFISNIFCLDCTSINLWGMIPVIIIISEQLFTSLLPDQYVYAAVAFFHILLCIWPWSLQFLHSFLMDFQPAKSHRCLVTTMHNILQ